MPTIQRRTNIPRLPFSTPMFTGKLGRELGPMDRAWELGLQNLIRLPNSMGMKVDSDRPPAIGDDGLMHMGLTDVCTHVDSTDAIEVIDYPEWLQPGGHLIVIPDAVFTWTTTGNIAVAGMAVVSQPLLFVWDGILFYPTYS